MLLMLALHAAVASLAPVLVQRLGRNAFPVLALAPAACFVWICIRAGQLDGNEVVLHETAWMPSLHLSLAFRFDALSALVGAVVTAVGALVLAYCSRYFSQETTGLHRFGTVLVLFAGAMLGLVLSDNVLVLYVFWELTTVFSYLLIGQESHRKASRRAAMQALIVTTAGGLALLVGFIILGEEAGSYLLTDIVTASLSGTSITVALMLILVGALSKSAIFPLHFWLPSAMAAPTPVSAYLHAAAMVKAGVFLVAVMAPAFANVEPWRAVVVTLGLTTMLLGGWRAMRQHDLKLLLAFGTVSQLGFLMALLGTGTRNAALAGTAMLVAHALFKATLFLTVGIIDKATGTRDLRRLSGLGRELPLVAVAGTLAAASMAGLPFFMGFVAKESAYDAYLHNALPHAAANVAALIAMVAGSALTFAYSARFVWGAFWTKSVEIDAPVRHRPSIAFQLPSVVLAVACIVPAIWISPIATLADASTSSIPQSTDEVLHLKLWHGVGPALGLSALTIGIGLVLFLRRDEVASFQSMVGDVGDADGAYRKMMRWVDRLAIAMTALTQRGSLPIYLGTIFLVLIALPGSVLVTQGSWPQQWELWDSPLQAVVAILAVAGAIAATIVKERVAAVLMVSVTGYSAGVLFAIHGAPDLALTQFLVETLTLVVFVLVLRKLPKTIAAHRANVLRKSTRLAVAVPVGFLMAGLGAVAMDARTHEPISQDLPQQAYDFGGGKNVVNVTLVDTRAWDTMGEISVLVVAATGVASLVFLRRRTGQLPRPHEVDTHHASPEQHDVGLAAATLVAPEHRQVVLEVATRMIFHTIMVLSVYLLFAGHNVPGGGFAGGLVAGLALVVRYLAAGRYELGEAAPIDAGLLLGLGLLLAGGTGVVGLVSGADVLQTAIIEGHWPLFGDVKLVTSLFFDIGVYLIVIGLVLDILRSLGARLDEQIEAT
jgi:multicomponent Na+:H+ antiporter subunit A